jgi:hypothetical protein
LEPGNSQSRIDVASFVEPDTSSSLLIIGRIIRGDGRTEHPLLRSYRFHCDPCPHIGLKQSAYGKRERLADRGVRSGLTPFSTACRRPSASR